MTTHALSGVTYEGEILFGTDEDKAMLRALGVQLLHETEGGGYTCRMHESVLRKLDGHWGRFFWSLAPGVGEGERA